jgi:hypothetical protein
MGQALSELVFIECVRTKAGSFGAGGTADQSMRTVEDARNWLSWIEQGPEENTAPVPEP